MNLRYISIGLGLTILYFTPSYILKKYIDHTKAYFAWQIKSLNDEVSQLAKKISEKDDENKEE